MKQPLPLGSPRDNARYRTWRESFQGYRHAINDNTIDRWFDQFADADKDLAGRILDSVEFIAHDQISRAYRDALGLLPGWSLADHERTGTWKFVAFTRSPGESGDAMMHRFRNANNVASNKYNYLFAYRSELMTLGPDDTVVFIDDFSGSGGQVTSYWPDLAELIPGGPTVYLVLIAVTSRARSEILDQTDLQVIATIDLNDSDNIFADACTRFSLGEKATIESYCRKADPIRPKGHGDCGLVVVFAHKAPNNTIPILHKVNAQWDGLFRRYD